MIDIFAADLRWQDWSARQLVSARQTGDLVINPIVYAEVAASFPTQRKLDEALGVERYKREGSAMGRRIQRGARVPLLSAFGWTELSPLPDFYIGAHADLRGYYLLTRDAGRYRQAFPALKIISPETHP